MKDQIDLIVVDLFHQHLPLQNLLNEFLTRSPVDTDAVRRTQTISYVAKTLLERKAHTLGIHRDQVLQQAILFRSALERYSAADGEQLELAREEVTQLATQARKTAGRVRAAVGSSHALTLEMIQIAERLQTLGQTAVAEEIR